MDHMLYYGALAERSRWRSVLGHDEFMKRIGDISPIEQTHVDDESVMPTEEDWIRMGELEVMICNFSRTSLVGVARERIVEMAQDFKSDYLFWWDADMRFRHSTFLRLWRHQVPVVGALAFTAREPIHPVMYRIMEKWDPTNNMQMAVGSDIVFDYPRDQLVGSEDVGGELAIGGGVTLYDMRVFKQIPKPWFASTGCGEDWFFSHRCKNYKIKRYIDTATKTQHKAHAPMWCDEEVYWRSREASRDSYVQQFGEAIPPVKDGKSMITKIFVDGDGPRVEEVAV
jgi:hypothetical protein